MWEGEQMPTEAKAEAGKILWKAGERACSEVAKRQRTKARTEDLCELQRTGSQ